MVVLGTGAVALALTACESPGETSRESEPPPAQDPMSPSYPPPDSSTGNPSEPGGGSGSYPPMR